MDGMVTIMEHGIRFINEYPEIGELLQRLFMNRELDEWYKNKCAEKIKAPDEFSQIKGLKKLKLEMYTILLEKSISTCKTFLGKMDFI